MKNNKISEVDAGQLARYLKDNRVNGDKYSFLLGAGASCSSDIRTGAELADEWYKELEEDMSPEVFSQWCEDEKIGSEQPRGKYYSKIFNKRFEDSLVGGYEYLKKEMADKTPSLGYYILAQVLTKEQHSLVVTTNFDNLLEDAIRRFTPKTPLVIGHEALAEYAMNHRDRPIIMKLHRDLLLEPKNTEEETKMLAEQWKKALKPVLSSSHLIVLGYGGNDGSLMDYLQSNRDKESSSQKKIYWCLREREELPPKAKELLDPSKDRIVRIENFDDFMYLLYDRLGYEELKDLDTIATTPPPHKLLETLHNNVVQLHKQMQRVFEHNRSKNFKKLLPKVYEILIAAEEENIERRDEIYQEGLKKYKDHPVLLGSYANFLTEIKEYDKAEESYQKSIEADPNHANNLGNYAVFLTDIKQDYTQAEEYYQQSLAADPKHANNLGNYANFLKDIKQDYTQAEEYYQKSLAADPKNANHLGNYANFLTDIKQEHDKAEEYYKQSLAADPNHANNLGNYAVFLTDIKQDYTQAEEYYLKFLAADPKHANNLGNYALFLEYIKKDYSQAEQYFLKALKSDSSDERIKNAYLQFKERAKEREKQNKV